MISMIKQCLLEILISQVIRDLNVQAVIPQKPLVTAEEDMPFVCSHQQFPARHSL